MSIQRRRTERGWSQEELALHSGLSVRTIQRIEAGRKAGLESLKCLAAVFETTVSELMQEQDMTTQTVTPTPSVSDEARSRAEKAAIEYVQNLRAFHLHWISLIIVLPALFFINRSVSPDIMWVYWAGLAWGAAFVLHAAVMFGMFGLFGASWEQRQFKLRLNQNR